jgi:hypothetical protein
METVIEAVGTAGAATVLARSGAEGGKYRMRHQPGERGGTWVVADEAGETRFAVARHPSGGRRLAISDAGGEEHASIGEVVLALTEHYTLWRGGRPFARVYRPLVRGRPERWLVELGPDTALVALVNPGVATLRLVHDGRQVAAVTAPDGDGAQEIELAPGTDAGLVLALALLVKGLDERRGEEVRSDRGFGASAE